MTETERGVLELGERIVTDFFPHEISAFQVGAAPLIQRLNGGTSGGSSNSSVDTELNLLDEAKVVLMFANVVVTIWKLVFESRQLRAEQAKAATKDEEVASVKRKLRAELSARGIDEDKAGLIADKFAVELLAI